jgi:hypothetical protein
VGEVRVQQAQADEGMRGAMSRLDADMQEQARSEASARMLLADEVRESTDESFARMACPDCLDCVSRSGR